MPSCITPSDKAPIAPLKVRCNDPYSAMVVTHKWGKEEEEEGVPPPIEVIAPPRPMTVHGCLDRRLRYISYDSKWCDGELRSFKQAQLLPETVKLFVGCFYHALRPGTLQWLVNRVGPRWGTHEFHTPSPHYGDSKFSGCITVYLTSTHGDALMRCLHSRVLFDLNGIWYAETDEEMALLAYYRRGLKQMKEKYGPREARRILLDVPASPMTCEFAKH